MPGLALDDRSILVMAHPDDEVLWASSLLGPVGRLLLAYETLPGRPDVTAGRRAALARFPRPVESLRLAETAAFGAAAWPDPLETAEGLALAAGPGTMRGFDPEAYRAGFAGLKARLRPELAGAATVVTHAPWGEYGHEDHVQLFRAVDALQRRARLRALGAGLRQRPLGGADAAQPRPARRADRADADRPGARRAAEGALPRDRRLDLGRRPRLARHRGLLPGAAGPGRRRRRRAAATR